MKKVNDEHENETLHAAASGSTIEPGETNAENDADYSGFVTTPAVPDAAELDKHVQIDDVSLEPPRRAPWYLRLPIIIDLRRSHGLQRGMLVAGLILVAILLIAAIFAPLLAPYEWAQQADKMGRFGTQQPPSGRNPWGTTVAGYDVLSRTIWGTRTAVAVIFFSVVASSVLGVILGLISGYLGGWLDRVLVMIADAIYAFPSLLLAIVLSIGLFGGKSGAFGGIVSAALSITVVFVPQYFRVIRAEAVRLRHEPFVEASKVVGAPSGTIMFKHVLRNSTRTLPLIFTLNCSESILTLAGLGFIGFGIEPTAASEWGYDLNRSMSDVASGIWWTSIFPGIAIVLAVLGITLVGESLNDLNDPRLRTRKGVKRGGKNKLQGTAEQQATASANALANNDTIEPVPATGTTKGGEQ